MDLPGQRALCWNTPKHNGKSGVEYNASFRILAEIVFGLRYTITKTSRLTNLQV